PRAASDCQAKVTRLIEAGAFHDAILALQELELPQWKLRRVIYDDGEWHCSFSKQLGMPAELDEMAEAVHEVLPLAMLSAFLEFASSQPLYEKPGSKHTPRSSPNREWSLAFDQSRVSSLKRRPTGRRMTPRSGLDLLPYPIAAERQSLRRN